MGGNTSETDKMVVGFSCTYILKKKKDIFFPFVIDVIS